MRTEIGKREYPKAIDYIINRLFGCNYSASDLYYLLMQSKDKEMQELSRIMDYEKEDKFKKAICDYLRKHKIEYFEQYCIFVNMLNWY